MICPNCASQNSDQSIFCCQCGQSLPQGNTGQSPENFAQTEDVRSYLTEAILVTLFCCMPLGIVAIVHAAQVSAKVAAGQFAAAREDAAAAKKWCWISFGSFLLIMTFQLLIFIIFSTLQA